MLAAGETTVTVRGAGRGGRNQEMALAWALKMQSWRKPVCFASVATDGTDGPTTAAGGIVDPYTCSRAIAMDMEPMKFLRDNDSFTFLQSVRDLITTGPTQTNLMDFADSFGGIEGNRTSPGRRKVLVLRIRAAGIDFADHNYRKNQRH